VNGDVQRGKSTVEAFKALVVKRINDSDACRDKCFTVLGTHLVPWAADVANKMQRAATAPVDEDDEAELEAVDALEENAERLFRVTPITAVGRHAKQHDDELQRTMAEGGCIVFSRTGPRMDKVTSLVFAFTSMQHAAQLTVSAHYVILDEARRARVLVCAGAWPAH
jgi:hypothetical protein